MGGSGTVDWSGALSASYEAALAREEEVAADDLAFSLRQDVDVRAVVERSDSGWALGGPEGARLPVDEVGVDYVRAGALLVRTRSAILRSASGRPPRTTTATFFELLGRACRQGVEVTLDGTPGRLVRVAKDHVALLRGESETIVGLDAVGAVRLCETTAYSASRGLRG